MSIDLLLFFSQNPFGCGDCPFTAPDASTLSLHRIHHQPNLKAIFKCYLCPYYVSTKAYVSLVTRFINANVVSYLRINLVSCDIDYLFHKVKKIHANFPIFINFKKNNITFVTLYIFLDET